MIFNKTYLLGVSSVSSSPEANTETNTVEKSSMSLRKPIIFSQNGTTPVVGDEQVLKKKRGRKPKSETNNNSIVRFCCFCKTSFENNSLGINTE
jgi:hypothetical protein